MAERTSPKGPDSPSWAYVASPKNRNVLKNPQQQTSDSVAPNTFRGRYASQVMASEALQPKLREPVTPITSNMVNSKKDIALLNATISALNDDLSRRNSDLIEARSSLLSKTAEVDNLKSTVASLSEQLESAQTKQDAEMRQLQFENASLKDAIHTGVISIAQVYGPGSVTDFNTTGLKVAKAAKSEAIEFTKRLQFAAHHQSPKTTLPSAHTKNTAEQGQQSVQKSQRLSKQDEQVANQKSLPAEVAIAKANSFSDVASNNPEKMNKSNISKQLGQEDAPSDKIPTTPEPIEKLDGNTDEAIARKKPQRADRFQGGKVKQPQVKANTNRNVTPGATATQGTPGPAENADGWITVPAKKQPVRPKGKRWLNGKGKGRAGSGPQNSKPQNNQAESPKKGKIIGNQQSRPQGSPANRQQRKPAKKRGGLVIGSSSKFSQSPKQADEKPVQNDNKQDSSVSPAKVPTKSQSPGQGCKQP
ncbi:hypothetical protein ABKA04_001299 [Annulohypoxylon sp. FPYF3050]